MQRQHIRTISLIAAVGLLLFVLSLWMRQPAETAETVRPTKRQHLFCGVVSSSLYLIEIKPRINSVVSGNTEQSQASILFAKPQHIKLLPLLASSNYESASPPLWLLNRSILI